MPFAIRHRDDLPPLLPSLPGLEIRREADPEVIAAVQERSPEEMMARFDAGHRAYIARMEGDIAAWGWVATRTAVIGELGIRFRIPATERYLWNFVTRSRHRGRGIYPRLLQRIVERESRTAERFWIIHAPENRASGSGIRKAGFAAAGEVSFDRWNRPAVQCQPERGEAAFNLLGLPIAAEDLAPCWRCARAGRRWIMFCPPDRCTCDYQDPRKGCGS